MTPPALNPVEYKEKKAGVNQTPALFFQCLEAESAFFSNVWTPARTEVMCPDD
jgi:hypothetical protein